MMFIIQTFSHSFGHSLIAKLNFHLWIVVVVKNVDHDTQINILGLMIALWQIGQSPGEHFSSFFRSVEYIRIVGRAALREPSNDRRSGRRAADHDGTKDNGSDENEAGGGAQAALPEWAMGGAKREGVFQKAALPTAVVFGEGRRFGGVF